MPPRGRPFGSARGPARLPFQARRRASARKAPKRRPKTARVSSAARRKFSWAINGEIMPRSQPRLLSTQPRLLSYGRRLGAIAAVSAACKRERGLSTGCSAAPRRRRARAEHHDGGSHKRAKLERHDVLRSRSSSFTCYAADDSGWKSQLRVTKQATVREFRSLRERRANQRAWHAPEFIRRLSLAAEDGRSVSCGPSLGIPGAM